MSFRVHRYGVHEVTISLGVLPRGGGGGGGGGVLLPYISHRGMCRSPC